MAQTQMTPEQTIAQLESRLAKLESQMARQIRQQKQNSPKRDRTLYAQFVQEQAALLKQTHGQEYSQWLQEQHPEAKNAQAALFKQVGQIWREWNQSASQQDLEELQERTRLSNEQTRETRESAVSKSQPEQKTKKTSPRKPNMYMRFSQKWSAQQKEQGIKHPNHAKACSQAYHLMKQDGSLEAFLE